MAGISQLQEPNSSLQSTPFCSEVLRSRFSFGPIVCSSSTVSPEGDGGDHLTHADLWEEFWIAHDAIGPPVLFHKVWRSHATEAEITAGLVSPLEAYGNEAADKLAARGALRNAFSMEYGAATRNTDSRVRLVQTRLIEINLMDVQNRTKTVRVKAKAPERRAKFDPDEAMCQLNKIGHDFSRVQVGEGRFT